jgi:ribosomal protein S18 acetylase RimI-like enzyme
MVLLAAEADGELVGLVWVGRAPGERGGWWIYDIDVVPDQRRRGYGRALLEAAEHAALERGADSVGMNVFGGNDAARRLYESSGYDVAAIFMRKPLAS